MSEQAPNDYNSLGFFDNGYDTGIPVLSGAEATQISMVLDDIFGRFEQPTDSLRHLHLFLPWAYDLLFKPEIVNPVSAILGGEVLARGGMVLAKLPYSSSEVLWHSDHAYTQKGHSPQLSAWIAITPSFQENGCMKVVPGSHRVVHEHHEIPGTKHQLYKNLKVVQDPKPADVVMLELLPGQMSLHDPMILHASGPSLTDIPRIGFIIRYSTPEYEADHTPTIRIKGNKPCQHLNIVQPVFEKNYETQVAKFIAYNKNYQVNGHT